MSSYNIDIRDGGGNRTHVDSVFNRVPICSDTPSLINSKHYYNIDHTIINNFIKQHTTEVLI